MSQASVRVGIIWTRPVECNDTPSYVFPYLGIKTHAKYPFSGLIRRMVSVMANSTRIFRVTRQTLVVHL
jgi:hypothetical protein